MEEFPDGDPVERSTLLYMNATAREERLEEKREHMFRQQHPFRPETTPASRRIKRKSGNVFGDLYDNAKERLAGKLAQQASPDDSVTFRPSLTKLAGAIRRKDAGPAYEHLYRLAKERESKLEAKREQAAAKTTFRPEVNVKSAQMVRGKGKGGCVNRLYSPDALSKRYQEREAAKEERFREVCTFKPTIGGAEGKGEGAAPSSQGADARATEPWRRFDEQYKAHQRRIAAMQREKEEEAMKECTFQPRINSKLPNGRSPTSKFRISMKGQGERAAQADEAFAAAHPFKPSLNPVSHKLASRKVQSPQRAGQFRVADMEALADKQRRLEELRRRREKEREDAELAECTFRPRISRGPASPHRGQGAPDSAPAARAQVGHAARPRTSPAGPRWQPAAGAAGQPVTAVGPLHAAAGSRTDATGVSVSSGGGVEVAELHE